MTRKFLCAVGAVALLLSIEAASAGEVVWPSYMWGEANNLPVMMELKQKFEAETPGAIVKNITVPSATFWDKQFADLSSGNPADVVTMFDPEMRAFLEAGLLEPLNGYLEAAGINTKEFIPTASLAEKGGTYYAVPMQINARALFYNAKLLGDAGLKPPTNAQEFEAAIERLRKPEAQQFGYATLAKPSAANVVYLEIMPIVMGYGGGFFAHGKPSATQPETVAALKFIKHLYDDQLIPRGMDFQAYRQLFAQGKVGMYATGGFFAAVVQAANPETYANLRAVPMPLPGKAMSITVFLGVPKAAKNKDQAAKLLVRMLKDDIQQAFVIEGKTLPGLVGKVPADFAKENVWFPAFEKAALASKSYAPEGAEQYGAEIIKIVAEHIEAMLFNGVSAEETSSNLQKALEAFIAAKHS